MRVADAQDDKQTGHGDGRGRRLKREAADARIGEVGEALKENYYRSSKTH